MAGRKLARRTTGGSIASHNQDMVSALLSPPLSPLPLPQASPPLSAYLGDKRLSHEDRCEKGEEDEEKEKAKTTMATSEEASSPPSQQLTDTGELRKGEAAETPESGGGERLDTGRVGKEEFLKDWTDCVTFDRSLVPSGLVSAKSALIEEYRRSAAGAEGVRINLGAN